MSRNYVFAPGEYYHIYARGVEKLAVYREKSDYKNFIERLYLLNTNKAVNVCDIKHAMTSLGLTSGGVFEFERDKTLVDIGAYCLMPNHFHILVREKNENGKGISRFMQKLMTSYTMYFNKKHNRTGALFGSSFKARHVTDDNHLKYLFAYIHLNPKEIIDDVNRLDRYYYSSYQDYLKIKRVENKIINATTFPDYFSDDLETMEQWIEEFMSPEV